MDVFAHIYSADVLVHRGALAEATGHVDALIPTARDSNDPQVLVPGLAVVALLASARGDLGRAAEHARELERFTGEAPCGARYVSRGRSGWRSRAANSTWPRRSSKAPSTIRRGTWLPDPARGRGEAAGRYAEAAGRWAEYGSVVEQAYALLGLGRVVSDAKALREGQSIFDDLGASPVVAQAA